MFWIFPPNPLGGRFLGFECAHDEIWYDDGYDKLLISPEVCHGARRIIVAVDDACVNQSPAPDETASNGARFVALWNRLYAVVRVRDCCGLFGLAARAESREP